MATSGMILTSAAMLAAFACVQPAASQTYTVRNINRVPQFGDVAAAEIGTTVFANVNADISVQSGNGSPIRGPVRQGLVTIRCQGSGNPNSCGIAGNEARVRIGSLSASGRAMPITEFRAHNGTGTIISGTTNGAALDFVLIGWSGSGNVNFKLDAVMPVLGDNQSSDSSGTAYFYVYASKNPDLPSTGLSDAATVNVRRAMRMSKIDDLRFGAVAKNPNGAGEVSIDAYNDNSRSFGGNNPPSGLPSNSYGRAVMRIRGEPHSNFSITYAPNNSLPLTNGSATLNVSLEKTVAGSTSLPPSGELFIGVGGTVNIPKNKPSGEYQGNLTVSASYN